MTKRRANDLRSVSDFTLKVYLYSLAAWGIALAVLFPFGVLGWALTLCFPLAIWLGGVTVWWWVGTRKARASDELTHREMGAGVKSIGRLLAFGGMIPGIIFVANDPFTKSAWGAFGGVAAVTAIGWAIANLGPRLHKTYVHTVVLFLTWLVLPLNATGTVTVAWFMGFMDKVTSTVGA